MPTQSYPDLHQFYSDKVLAITGGTGFLGQGLIEKLLRCCPDIKQILLFIRTKKGVKAEERLIKLWNEPAFDDLRSDYPEAFNKLMCIPCDLSDSKLGLSTENWKYVTTEVNIFIHSAASLRFNEHIRTSFETNVKITQRIIKLCKKIDNLVVFVHMSTAFCNCNRDTIEEKVIPTATNYKDLERSLDWMSDRTLDMVLPDLLDERPNTYTLTKAMAEDVVVDECSDLPCCIVRPAMIIPAENEPQPGWINNVYGPTAMVAGYMKGLMRHVICKQGMKCELVPVDYVVNSVLAAAMKTACDKASPEPTHHANFEGEFSTSKEHDRSNSQSISKSEVIPVYHCVTGSLNPVSSKLLLEGLEHWNSKHPAIPILPLSRDRCSCREAYAFKTFWTTTIPAYILDILLRCAWQKPRFVIINNKINAGMTVMEFFFTRTWDIKFDETMKLFECLSKDDKVIFNFHPKTINWWEFTNKYARGVHKFILKETPEDVRYARKKIFWFQASLGLVKMITRLGISYTIPAGFDVDSMVWNSPLCYERW